jgi:hypothetical protein
VSNYLNGIYQGPFTWHGIENPDLATQLYDAFWAAYDQLALECDGDMTGKTYTCIGDVRSTVPLALISRSVRSGYPTLLWQRMAEMLEASDVI